MFPRVSWLGWTNFGSHHPFLPLSTGSMPITGHCEGDKGSCTKVLVMGEHVVCPWSCKALQQSGVPLW